MTSGALTWKVLSAVCNDAIVLYGVHGGRRWSVTILSYTSINRCRMRFLGAALYGLSGASTRSDYARFCDRLYRPGFYTGMDVDQIRAVPLNRKWYALLDHGVQLKTGCLQRLLHACPELEKVLNNELWTVLGWDSQDPMASVRFIETHRPRCRALEGSTYRGRVNARMKWALGVPDWTRLAVPLALLADVGHPLQRRWLNEHFCNYLALASLAPPPAGLLCRSVVADQRVAVCA